jgi:hypothetical protein
MRISLHYDLLITHPGQITISKVTLDIITSISAHDSHGCSPPWSTLTENAMSPQKLEAKYNFERAPPASEEMCHCNPCRRCFPHANGCHRIDSSAARHQVPKSVEDDDDRITWENQLPRFECKVTHKTPHCMSKNPSSSIHDH